MVRDRSRRLLLQLCSLAAEARLAPVNAAATPSRKSALPNTIPCSAASLAVATRIRSPNSPRIVRRIEQIARGANPTISTAKARAGAERAGSRRLLCRRSDRGLCAGEDTNAIPVRAEARGAPSWHRRSPAPPLPDCSLSGQCGREGSSRRVARLRLEQQSAGRLAGGCFRGEAQASLDRLRRAERSSAVGRC